jgi:5-oxoprolinase (ATP-hydrolysing) subunit A
MATVDLNSDLGEGFGMWSMGDDAAMLDIVTSANVACGFHAGDSDIMLSISKLAKQKGVSVGAHPGYRDLHGFGRRPVPGLTASEIETMVAYQIGALQAVATMAGHRVSFVKVHGALSNVACADPMTAKALASAIKAVDRDLIWVVLPRSEIERAGEAANLPLVRELFADRAYEDDASLMSRSKPGSVLHDADAIAERVLRMVNDQAVVSASGKTIKMPVDTICVHGDTPGAVSIARQVRSVLEKNGHKIAPFAQTAKV